MFKKEYPLSGIAGELLDIKPWHFFLLLCVLTLLLLFIKKNYIEYEITAFQILDERGELGVFRILTTLQYLSVPAVYMVKFTFIAFFIWVASFGFGYRITYASCWQIVMVSEIIFVVPELMKIAWFLLVRTDPNYFEVLAFYPFSMMNLFNFENVAKEWHYPLKALNLFEIVYWVLVIAGIYVKSRKKYRNAVYIGLFGGVLPFLVWLGYYVIVYK
jgi:hypothetical protein